MIYSKKLNIVIVNCCLCENRWFKIAIEGYIPEKIEIYVFAFVEDIASYIFFSLIRKVLIRKVFCFYFIKNNLPLTSSSYV